MLSSTGRWIRSIAAALVLVALGAGTVWGDDHHFPFGPFRMYSTTTKPSGSVTLVRFEARTSSGDALLLTSKDFGLRPAEVLGQVPRLREDPSLLRHFATAYENARDGAVDVVGLRMFFLAYRLEDGRPVGMEESPVARWGSM